MRDAGGWVEGVFDLLADDVAPAVDAVCVDVLQDVDAVPGSGGDFSRRAGCAQLEGQGGMPQVVGSAGERRGGQFRVERGLTGGVPDAPVGALAESDLARESAVMRRAVALAGWLADSGPRLLTGREVLRKPDVPAAAAVIGVKAPQALRSAADIPDLHRAWLLALAAGLVAVTDGKAVARSTALPDQDAEVLSAWLDALRASAAAEYGQRSVPDDILLSSLEVVAADPADPRAQGWVQQRSACWSLLDAFGAVAEGPEVTPLGRWAMERLADSQPVMPENLTAAEMLARLAMFDQAQRRDLSEIGAELGSPLLEFGQLGSQAPNLAVDARQFRPGLLVADVTVAVPGPGKGLDHAAEQSQPRVPVHIGLAVLQRARVDRVVDLVLGQPELLPGGLVAQRRALALPSVVRIGHVCSSWRPPRRPAWRHSHPRPW